ncbi:COG2426 family protein [uncultured Neglectibacter sp.]|uniref:COG2426 family protein n=1 Tax=uncultured Neglectibacter sp. TaxID=1924108 RepID=UPI0034E01E7D
MEGIVQALVGFFSETIPAELTVFLLSLMPIIELRGGILAAKLLHLDMLRAFSICLVGTLLPTPFILLFINKIFDWMRNTRFVKLVDRLEAKGRSKFDKINRYKTVGLMIFVAIPLPGTGAWTGSLAAALMKMDFKSAMLSVALGTLIADIIMCVLSYGVLGLVIS